MTTPQPSVLTINVFKAYLNPLLTKHEGGKVIVYEDLLASWEAVQAVLSKNESTPDASQVVSVLYSVLNSFVYHIHSNLCVRELNNNRKIKSKLCTMSKF